MVVKDVLMVLEGSVDAVTAESRVGTEGGGGS